MCLRHEIRCVCKLTEGLCYGNASCIKTKYFVLQFIATVYIWVTLHTAVKMWKSNSSLSMPAYADKDREMDFVVLHMRTLVWVPVHYEFAYANIGL